MPKKKLRFKIFHNPAAFHWRMLEEYPEYTIEGLDRSGSIRRASEWIDANYEKQKKVFHDKDWETYIDLSAERKLPAFLHIQKVLNDEDFFYYLARSVTESDENWKHRDELLKLIKKRSGKHTFFQNSKDNKCFSKLPNELKIFRGCNKLNKKGLSWSLLYRCAKLFATTYIKSDALIQSFRAGASHEEIEEYNKCHPLVIHGTCKKGDVSVYTNERKEKEILIDPANVKVIKEEKV